MTEPAGVVARKLVPRHRVTAPMRLLATLVAVGLLAAACGADDAAPDPQGAAGGGPEAGGAADDPVRSALDGGDDPTAAAGATRPLELTAPSSTPPVDRTTSIVGLDDVVFDTFDGGSVRLSEATDEVIAALFDAIRPIDGPDYETADDANLWLTPGDVVLGYVDGEEQAWAYPVRILNFHEIVNDELAGRPVLVSYCPLCGSGVVFDRRSGDLVLSFSNTSALHENDLVMVDRETGSYWWQVPGRAIVGELSGTSLTPLVSETATWSSWRQRHPETVVLARLPGRDYSRDPFVSYAETVDSGRTPFPVDPDVLADDRLTPATLVIVAEIGGEVRAWPVAPERTVVDEVAGIAVEVVTDGVGGRVTADGVPQGVRTSFWFAIVASFPEVTVGP